MDNIEDIRKQANYCLNCKNKPCSNGCPINTKIPEFIEKVKEEKIEEAYEILSENNIFSYICSLICPQEQQCEGSCIRGIKQKPTQIGKLEKFVNEWAIDNKVERKKIEIKEKDKKVAIIGSGPAGLECAYELRKEGFQVTVFEKEKVLGGILTYGIPDFRLDKRYVKEIIDSLKKLGVKFETENELGDKLHLSELKQKYDAIFLGIGAEVPSKYDLGNFDNIYDSDYFLKSYNNNKFINNLGDVVVIGGGNVAMDCSRAALKMGATSSSILYRRDEKHMPARNIELEEAINDGVKKVFTTRVIEAKGKDRKIESVKCIKTEVIDGKAKDIPNSEFEYKANTVVFAIGLKPNQELLLKENLKYNENGLIEIDENCRTNIENVYAGGDLSESKATVCRAIAGGKRAAASIIKTFEKGEKNV